MSKPLPEANEARKLVAVNLRRLRLAAGYSQERMALLAGFHRTYVSQLERCKINLTIDAIWRLAQLLGAHPGEFLKPTNGGTDTGLDTAGSPGIGSNS
ncbi:MAG TPA: helix-turn-helix transcriptional regulator [Pararobbsia sp.]|jgi:transcriptional regulator with XRE-family HTH domain|nr:helix-turn-helix transcriptional regulator [Pararobbsia sp.]